jgi:NADH:ubiquinone oxidoreductase subunit 3 (subunit A)
MTNSKKLNVRLLVVVLLTIVGSGLLIAGFIVPPLGVIDSSILVAFGETSTFVAAVLGVDYNYRYKQFKMETARRLRDNE